MLAAAPEVCTDAAAPEVCTDAAAPEVCPAAAPKVCHAAAFDACSAAAAPEFCLAAAPEIYTDAAAPEVCTDAAPEVCLAAAPEVCIDAARQAYEHAVLQAGTIAAVQASIGTVYQVCVGAAAAQACAVAYVETASQDYFGKRAICSTEVSCTQRKEMEGRGQHGMPGVYHHVISARNAHMDTTEIVLHYCETAVGEALSLQCIHLDIVDPLLGAGQRQVSDEVHRDVSGNLGEYLANYIPKTLALPLTHHWQVTGQLLITNDEPLLLNLGTTYAGFRSPQIRTQPAQLDATQSQRPGTTTTMQTVTCSCSCLRGSRGYTSDPPSLTPHRSLPTAARTTEHRSLPLAAARCLARTAVLFVKKTYAVSTPKIAVNASPKPPRPGNNVKILRPSGGMLGHVFCILRPSGGMLGHVFSMDRCCMTHHA